MKEQRCSIQRAAHQGFEAVVIENGLLRLSVVPELGGKFVSLVRLESGHEFLLQSLGAERCQPRSYGDLFENYASCGFDECVPTIGECLYPEEPFLSRQVPDHGDVWCLPSSVETAGDKIKLTTVLRSLPLRFTRSVQLHRTLVRLDYEATNLSQASVKFLWSAHPLLRVEPGAEIVLPEEVNEVEVGWSRGERLGKSGNRSSWPRTTSRLGSVVELNQIVSANAGTAEKLFTPPLTEGFCGVFLPRANESIAFRFDTKFVPYVGIWACQGGWPVSRASKDFTVALEPCNGRPDSLKDSIERDECPTLPGYGSMQWWMEIEVKGGAPRSPQVES